MSSRARRSLAPFIAALAVAAVPPAAADAAAYASRTLRVGSHGTDVKLLQRYVSEAGHRASRDGQFGTRTERSLRATETELELRADGVATRREQRDIQRAVDDYGSGGTTYVAPPPPTTVVAGAKATIRAHGFAVPPASAPQVVKDVIAAGNAIAKTPYKWVGGHANWNDTGYDCSGSVSYALHGGGRLDSPLVSGDFAHWDTGGTGAWISIYANASHLYMVVAGLRFDTSARSHTGSRWTSEMRPSDGFAGTHPKGL